MKSMDLEETELIENVKSALNPKVSYWVLFCNGTVIVFDSLTNGENIKEKAIKHMKEFGPVWPASAAADFGIVNLVSEKRLVSYWTWLWNVYLCSSTGTLGNPHDVEIGIYGRSKRHKDSEEMKIIYVVEPRV